MILGDAKPEDREQIALFIINIETDHKQGPDGNVIAVDYITFGKRGAPNHQQIISIDRLKKEQPMVWDYFRKTYEGWKENNTIAAVGHPLEAWPAITKGQIKICKSIGLRSVEDIVNSTDSVREKFGMGFLDLRNQAKLFLESKEATASAHEKAELQRRLETLEAALQESRATIDGLMAEKGKRPVGRPRKDAAEAA